ncbi:MAG: transcription elongation factor GreA [Acidaminococcaceae bacterium]|nr:transcription elongation factor GreA [Acidaminococcaceae bacterium]
MVKKETLLTSEGLQKLQNELEYLRTTRREEVVQRLAEARSHGDLSENSEYDEARNEQAFVEGRIQELEQQINTAVIIDEKASGKKGQVRLGSTVVVKDLEFDEEEVYKIVGTTEADPFNNLISNDSPVGKAVIGRMVGNVVSVNTPAGELSYKIVDVR